MATWAPPQQAAGAAQGQAQGQRARQPDLMAGLALRQGQGPGQGQGQGQGKGDVGLPPTTTSAEEVYLKLYSKSSNLSSPQVPESGRQAPSAPGAPNGLHVTAGAATGPPSGPSLANGNDHHTDGPGVMGASPWSTPQGVNQSQHASGSVGFELASMSPSAAGEVQGAGVCVGEGVLSHGASTLHGALPGLAGTGPAPSNAGSTPLGPATAGLGLNPGGLSTLCEIEPVMDPLPAPATHHGQPATVAQPSPPDVQLLQNMQAQQAQHAQQAQRHRLRDHHLNHHRQRVHVQLLGPEAAAAAAAAGVQGSSLHLKQHPSAPSTQEAPEGTEVTKAAGGIMHPMASHQPPQMASPRTPLAGIALSDHMSDNFSSSTVDCGNMRLSGSGSTTDAADVMMVSSTGAVSMRRLPMVPPMASAYSAPVGKEVTDWSARAMVASAVGVSRADAAGNGPYQSQLPLSDVSPQVTQYALPTDDCCMACEPEHTAAKVQDVCLPAPAATGTAANPVTTYMCENTEGLPV